jgi:antitoxin Phd
MKKRKVRSSRSGGITNTVAFPASARRVPATEVKNRFGDVFERALRGEPVVITKHGEPKALLISVDDFSNVAARTQTELNTLTREFDELLERMQTEKARTGMQEAFEASPEELGRAAVHAARRT